MATTTPASVDGSLVRMLSPEAQPELNDMKSRDNIPYRFPSTAQIISPLSLPRPSISTISTSLLSYTSDYLQPPEPPQSFFSFTVPRLSNTDALQPPSQLQGFRVSDFAIVRTLGQGSFGRVHLVQSRYNSHYYAMKVLRKSYITKKDQVAHTNSERFMLSSLNHSFIIRLWASFQDAEYLYMILDFAAGGDLFQLLRRSGKFPEKVVKFYSAEVALALNFMHSCNVIYRDLKLENILIGGDGHIKVADFGFAKVADERAWTLCGTPDYIAPEVIRGERYNQSIDWYALGVLIYEMMVGTPPFWAPDVNALYERIMYGTSIVAWPENVFGPPAVPPAMSGLAPTTSVMGPPATDVVDLILQLMHNDPTRRLGNLLHGAGDLFQHPFYAEVDWARLLAKEITPPYQPDLTHPGDASAFAPCNEEVLSYPQNSQQPDELGVLFPAFEYAAPDVEEEIAASFFSPPPVQPSNVAFGGYMGQSRSVSPQMLTLNHQPLPSIPEALSSPYAESTAQVASPVVVAASPHTPMTQHSATATQYAGDGAHTLTHPYGDVASPQSALRPRGPYTVIASPFTVPYSATRRSVSSAPPSTAPLRSAPAAQVIPPPLSAPASTATHALQNAGYPSGQEYIHPEYANTPNASFAGYAAPIPSSGIDYVPFPIPGYLYP